MSNISANSGGNLSFVQFLRNQSRRLACLAPSALSSGILCEMLVTEPPDPSPEGRAACTLSASNTRSCSLCTALTSFSPARSLSSTAAENRPSSVSVNWWAFSDDVTCIHADTKSGYQRSSKYNKKNYDGNTSPAWSKYSQTFTQYILLLNILALRGRRSSNLTSYINSSCCRVK